MTTGPDPRWATIAAGISPDGTPIPMSFEVLARLSEEWRRLVGESVPDETNALLAASRSLFAHSWFDYDFMPLACLISFQAVEATLRLVVFPEATGRQSFRSLVDRTEKCGILAAEDGNRIRAGVKLRNSLAHPRTRMTFSIGMAAPSIEQSHLVVEALCQSGRGACGRSKLGSETAEVLVAAATTTVATRSWRAS